MVPHLPFCLAALLPTLAAAQQAPDARAAELLTLEQRWNDAIVQRDTVFIKQLLTDDFEYIAPDGRVNNKAAVLRAVRNPESVVQPFKTEDVRVRFYGKDAAVLTGWFHQTGTWRGQPFDVRMRYTDLYVRQGGKWRAATVQAARMPAKS